MKVLRMALALVLLLGGCASTADLPNYLSAKPAEVNGVVEDWQKDADPATSTLTMWPQEIQGSSYALMQVRAGLDTYRFALSRDQVLLFIDAINNYQSIASQTKYEQGTAIGWLAKTPIKLKRTGDVAKDDTLIVNVERKGNHPPFLTVTFESWLLTFAGSDSPADRTYKQIDYLPESATQIRAALEKLHAEM